MPRERTVYLDHNATTPVDPRVLEAMLPALRELFANPASRSHAPGRAAREAMERARDQVATTLGARRSEVIFTSGATESANLALKGVAALAPRDRRHLVASAVEHSAVRDTLRALERQRFEVSWVAPDERGRVSAESIAEALRPDTLLAAVIWANNEVGTIAPVREIGALCKDRGVLFFTDATQAVGKVPVDVDADGVDMLCLSAHKLYGPKGSGALYVRRREPRVRLEPQIHGGGHERGLRSGTPNLPGIVGLGAACELATAEMPAEAARLARLRDGFEARVLGEVPAERNGDPDRRLPGTSHLSFPGVEAEDFMAAASDLAVSSGAACSSASLEPSHVLAAMGLGPARASSSIRFGFGRFTTDEEALYAAERVVEVAQRLGSTGPPLPKTPRRA